jgi:hypothetical protein
MAVDTFRARTPAPSGATTQDRASRILARLRAIHVSTPVVVVLLLALTAISFVLRIQQIHFHFWVDEGISVGIASHPLSQLPHLLREDGSPPLYYALLHVWIQAFGHSEAATHALSLVFALITVPVAYWAGSSLFDRRVGAYSAVIAAGLPFLTTYAQETRMYSLLLLVSLLAATGFTHAFVFRRRRYLPLFVVALEVALYTHNWALFFGLGCFVAWLTCVWLTARGERRPVVIDGIMAFGAVAILYLPWLPTLVFQAQHTGAPWALPPVLWSITSGMYTIVGGRGAAVAILLAGGSGLVAMRAAGAGERRNLRSAITLAVLGFGTLLIAWAYAKTTPAWAERYLAVIIGPLILLAALALRRAAGLGLIALLLISCFWVLDPRTTHQDAKSNVGGAAQEVRRYINADTVVLSSQPEQVPVLSYYLPKVTKFATPLGQVPDPRVMDWQGALAKFEHSRLRTRLIPVLQSLQPGQRVVLAVPTSFIKEPEWMDLIRRDSGVWKDYMDKDSHLRLIAESDAHPHQTGIPMQLLVYQRR